MGISSGASRMMGYAPLVLILAGIAGCYFSGFDPIAAINDVIHLYGKNVTFSLFIVAVWLIFPLHEFIHALTHPDHGLSDSTVVGLRSSMVFVMYTGVMSRMRFITMLLAPLFVIGIILLTLFFIFNGARPVITAVLFVHVMSCLGDIYLVFKMLLVGRKFDFVWNKAQCLLAR